MTFDSPDRTDNPRDKKFRRNHLHSRNRNRPRTR